MNNIKNGILNIAAIIGPNGVFAGRSGNAIKWTAAVEMIGWKDIDTDVIYLEKKRIVWEVNYEEIDEYRELIKANSIVNLLVNKSENRLSLERVLVQNYQDDDLARVLEQSRQPVFYDDHILGRFILDKTIEQFCMPIVWSGENGELYFQNNQDEELIRSTLQTGYVLFEDQEVWSKRVKEYAAEKLVALANDWCEEAEDTNTFDEITASIFVKRIRLSSITIAPDGDFEIFFYDDDMFAGHSIIVNGNVNGVFTDAMIAG